MEINILKCCRVCTDKNAETLSLFEDYKFPECNLQIFEVITKCAAVQIRRLDGFSERICKRCTERLREAYSFKRLCEDSDYKFRHNLIDAHEIDAYCDEATKIQRDNVKEKKIKEELNNIFIEVKSEIESEFFEEDTNIQYDILQEENVGRSSSDFTILQNLDTKPTNASQTSELNINLDYNNDQTKIRYPENNSKISDENGTHISSVVGIKIKNEFYAEETQIQYEKFQVCEKIILNNHAREKEPFNCEICAKFFSTKKALILHRKIHCVNKPYKCDICGICFNTKGTLNNHKRTHTGDKLYKCEICNKRFSEKKCLNIHQRLHTGEKPYKCETCIKSFIRREDLNVHKRIHTGENPYKCETCSNSFSRRNTLIRHRKCHSEDKPYKCEICSKYFTRKDELDKHKRIHTGEKPYKCETCSKCFTRKEDLNVHKSIHTGEKPYKCETCGKCFIRKAHLNRHRRIHNGETL